MRHIATIDELTEYVRAVMARCDHHAKHLETIVPLITGTLVLYAQPDSLTRLTNVLWFRSASTGQRYCTAYNHATRRIEVRDGTVRGITLFTFGEENGVDVNAVFSTL